MFAFLIVLTLHFFNPVIFEMPIRFCPFLSMCGIMIQALLLQPVLLQGSPTWSPYLFLSPLCTTADIAFLDFQILLSTSQICTVTHWLPPLVPWSLLWSCCYLVTTLTRNSPWHPHVRNSHSFDSGRQVGRLRENRQKALPKQAFCIRSFAQAQPTAIQKAFFTSL